MKKTVARIEAIKKELQSIANVHMDNGKKAVLADGKGNEVEFSPRTEPNEVLSPVDFVDYLTGKFDVDVAFSCVSIGMGKAQKLLGEHELAPFLHKVPGSRTLKAVRVAKVA
jgi:ribosomal protein S9